MNREDARALKFKLKIHGKKMESVDLFSVFCGFLLLLFSRARPARVSRNEKGETSFLKKLFKKKNEPAGGLVVYFFFPADGRSSSRKRAYLRQLNSVIRTFELLNHIIFISFSGEI